MDRRQYFNELEKLLRYRRVECVGEIITDYNDILNEKIVEGQTEWEVLESWGTPEFIASQYDDNSTDFDKFTYKVKTSDVVKNFKKFISEVTANG